MNPHTPSPIPAPTSCWRCAASWASAAHSTHLIARWHEPLWRYLRRLSGNDDAARDLAQDTWMRVFRGIARLREPAKLRPWLFGIARNVAMDRLRAQYAAGVARRTSIWTNCAARR